MNQRNVNECIKRLEFLISYAENVESKNLNKIVKQIQDITDPCIVIQNLFAMPNENDDDLLKVLCEFIFTYIQDQLDS